MITLINATILLIFRSKFPSITVRNRPPLYSSTFQPIPTTFLTEAFNDVTTTVRVTRPQTQRQPPLEPGKPSRSRGFYVCMTNCLTLSHYNPVCGTDHTTYHNVYKLECANRCGARPSKWHQPIARLTGWIGALSLILVFYLFLFFAGVQVRKPGIC